MLRSLLTQASLEGFETEMTDQRADSVDLQSRAAAFEDGLITLLSLSAQQLADARDTCTRDLTDTLQAALTALTDLWAQYSEELNKHILAPFWIAHGAEMGWLTLNSTVAAPYVRDNLTLDTDGPRSIGNRRLRFVGKVNTLRTNVSVLADSYPIGPGGRRFGPCNAHQSWNGRTTPDLADYGNVQPPDGTKTLFIEFRNGNPAGNTPGVRVVYACPAA